MRKTNLLSIRERMEIVDKVEKGISKAQIMNEYKISSNILQSIIHNADKIKILVRKKINLTKKNVNGREYKKYKQLKDLLYKWYRERIESKDFSESLFKAKGIELMRDFDGPSTIKARKQLLRRYLKYFEGQQESINCKFQISSENSREMDKTKQELNAEKFIREFDHKLGEENIKKDNIYTMIKIYFNLKSFFQYTHRDTNKLDIEKTLRNDCLSVIFCTNATGSHKLPPFYIYEYEDEVIKEYLKNTTGVVFTSKENESRNKIIANWYNNNFINLVRRHQQKTNITGKVLLLVKNCKEFILPEDAMQNDFEILFFPLGTFEILQPLTSLKNMKNKIHMNLRKVFEDFLTSYDLGTCIKAICEPWVNISPVCIELLWKKLLKSDFCTEENATSLVKQTSKLIKNVTEEDTVFRKSIAKADERIQSLFFKLFLQVSRKTENKTSTCMVTQTSKLMKNVTTEDTALEKTSEVDEKIQFLFSTLFLLTSRKTENATCIVQQTSRSIEKVTEEDTALRETPAEVNEKIQFLFSKLFLVASSKTENATCIVKHTSKLIKNITEEDTTFREIPAEIEAEIKEQENTEIKTDKFTELIQQHIQLRNVLRAAVHNVKIDNIPILYIAENYKLDVEILQLKIDILENRRKYLKNKIIYEAAVKDFISGRRNKHEAVRHYGISTKTLDKEIARCRYLGKEYKFDRIVMSRNQVGFTFQDDQLLLKSLEIWANRQYDQKSCNCSICALKYLSIIAYKFAKKSKMQYREDWDKYERTDIFWLREFEMRYSNDILIILYNSMHKNSKKEMSDKQQLSHLFDKNINFEKNVT